MQQLYRWRTLAGFMFALIMMLMVQSYLYPTAWAVGYRTYPSGEDTMQRTLCFGSFNGHIQLADFPLVGVEDELHSWRIEYFDGRKVYEGILVGLYYREYGGLGVYATAADRGDMGPGFIASLTMHYIWLLLGTLLGYSLAVWRAKRNALLQSGKGAFAVKTLARKGVS